jgi:hypothetical protein
VTFANGAAVNAIATFSSAGTYVLRVTGSDGALTDSDDVTVTVTAAGQPPPATLNVTIQVVGTPQPGQQATFYVDVRNAAGTAVSEAKVDFRLDTGDADQEPNYRWVTTSGTGGRATFRLWTTDGDQRPWTVTAVVSKDGAQATGTLLIN